MPGLAVSSAAEKSAVAYALRKGVVLVAPAGDDGAGAGVVNYPAAYPGVISVGAFDKNFTKAPFSSHEPYVTLTAAVTASPRQARPVTPPLAAPARPARSSPALSR